MSALEIKNNDSSSQSETTRGVTPKNVIAANNINFKSITLSISSPEEILNRSYGEVLKPETINYRTQRPERDGLYCERIFGPTKNRECYCKKYKKIKYKGIICERCGVEVTTSTVRRQRMGHIKLAAPVAHPWFLKGASSKLSLLLDVPAKKLEQVCIFAAYIIKNVNEEDKNKELKSLEKDFKKKKVVIAEKFNQIKNELELKIKAKEAKKSELVILEEEFAKKSDELQQNFLNLKADLDLIVKFKILSEVEYVRLREFFWHLFDAWIWAESLLEIVKVLDLELTLAELKAELEVTTTQKSIKIIKRIKVFSDFINNKVKPEWMILRVLPVIPPDLRPMVALSWGRFAASDTNDLYRRIINRNNRLKKLISLWAPEIIARNEKRMLQEAVDSLISASSSQGKTIFSGGNRRALKSLATSLKGKQGRFRQNLLGKRVDYSGRSVIVINPNIKLDECGIPKKMALMLFKPFVLGKLIRDGYANNIKKAEKLIEWDRKEVWDVLEEVTKGHYVLLNRAPTLHRLGIQAFKPILIEWKAIQIHPLVCPAFNADFDGDQMAVHLPLSKRARHEARTIMVSKHNLLKPATGAPIAVPSQDIVFGIYYLTNIEVKAKGEGMIFSSPVEAFLAYDNDVISLRSLVKVRIKGEIMETTIGRLKFNAILPTLKIGFINRRLDKKDVKKLIEDIFDIFGHKKTHYYLDAIKKIGFEYATKSGLTLSLLDVDVPKEKEGIIKEAKSKIKQVNSFFRKWFVNEEEKYQAIIAIWGKANNKIRKAIENHKEDYKDLFLMVDSGAKGSMTHISQIVGMKGQAISPSGKVIALPMVSSTAEWLNILEYFIGSHSGRKWLSDTALKTAQAGYLTRKLVDATQNLVVRKEDCGTKEYVTITKEEEDKNGKDFYFKAYGSYLATDVFFPNSKKVILEKGRMLDKEAIKILKEEKIEKLNLRSVLKCTVRKGVCKKCYGMDFGRGKEVELGATIGIMGAQSIWEPGTQLTMRTYHQGWVVGGKDITAGLPRIIELFEARKPKTEALMAPFDGEIKLMREKGVRKLVVIANKGQEFKILGSAMVKGKTKIKEGEAITVLKWKEIKSPYSWVVARIDDEAVYIIPSKQVEKSYSLDLSEYILVSSWEVVKKAQPLTNGHLDIRKLLEMTDVYQAQMYVVNEVQKIYIGQGQDIHDKHIELLARQMFSKVKIVKGGDSKFLPGDLADYLNIRKDNREIIAKKGQKIEYERVILWLTKIALNVDSWLASASFQNTIKVLIDATVQCKKDYLLGLKENIIIGHLLPVGSNFKQNKDED